MKVVILCGGRGTRLSEETGLRPKPLVEIGGRPILWHIMNIYASYGFKEFILALGYKGEAIKNYFLNYHYLRNNLTIQLGNGSVNVQDGEHDDWTVHLIDTGLQPETGGRLKRLAPWIGNEPFLFTYGDGVADINIPELVDFHRKNKKLATVTAVHPSARFGSLSLVDDRVNKFAEKPQLGEGWINGGFFVLEPKVLDYIKDDETAWELEPIEKLTSEKQLVAYRHSGFWQCMDNLRDVRYLENLWASGKPPWKTWK